MIRAVWAALQRAIDNCLRPAPAHNAHVDDVLLDLTTCPRCGTDLAVKVGER